MASSETSSQRVGAAVLVAVIVIALVLVSLGILPLSLTGTIQIDTSTHLETANGLGALSGAYPTSGHDLLDSAGYMSSFREGGQSEKVNAEFYWLGNCIVPGDVQVTSLDQYQFRVYLSTDDNNYQEVQGLDSTIQSVAAGTHCTLEPSSNYQFTFNQPTNGFVKVALWGVMRSVDPSVKGGWNELMYDKAYISTQTGTFTAPKAGQVFHVGDTVHVTAQIGQECGLTVDGAVDTSQPGWLMVLTSGANPTGLTHDWGCGPAPWQPVQTVSFDYVVQPTDFQGPGANGACGSNEITLQLFTRFLQKDLVTTLTIPIGAVQPAAPKISADKTQVTEGDSVTLTITPSSPAAAGSVYYVLQLRYSDGTIIPTPDQLNETSYTFQVPKPGTITATVNAVVDCIASNPASTTIYAKSSTSPNCETDPTACTVPLPWVFILAAIAIAVLVALAMAYIPDEWVGSDDPGKVKLAVAIVLIAISILVLIEVGVASPWISPPFAIAMRWADLLVGA